MRKLGCPRHLGPAPGTVLDALGSEKDQCGLDRRGPYGLRLARGPGPGANKQLDLRDMV